MKRTVVTIAGQTCEMPAFVDMRGMLQFLILWELRAGPLHGREIARRIGDRRGDPPNPGTLYPALQDLTSDGLLERREEGRRIAYDLTPLGRRELDCALTYFRAAYTDLIRTGPAPEPHALRKLPPA